MSQQSNVPTGQGRPRKDETRAETRAIAAKVTHDQADRFGELAEANGQTTSSQLRKLVEIYLDVHGED
jgi:hypothetical protein